MVANDAHTPARIIAGRYRLGSRLGSSLEAAVFEAFDQQVRRSVVLKLVHPDLGDDPQLQRTFRRLMPIAAGLHHPNIAAVHDYGTATWNDREVLYVVSEHLSGGSLRDLLDRGRLLSPSQALVVGLDACKALDALHRHGLVHTDVRPSTLVFGDDRQLRIIDVGLAQVLHDAAGDVTERTVDRAKYASPEEAQGNPVEPKSDVYALCLSLLEAVTASVPFVGDSAVATLANRVDKLMPVSADLGALAAVFERAGRPWAEDRSTAAEFGRALVQSAEKMPRPAPLPILVNPLFVADRSTPGQPVEPTGPLSRPTAPEASPPVVVAPAADVIDAEPPVAELAVTEPVEDAAVEEVVDSLVAEEPESAPDDESLATQPAPVVDVATLLAGVPDAPSLTEPVVGSSTALLGALSSDEATPPAFAPPAEPLPWPTTDLPTEAIVGDLPPTEIQPVGDGDGDGAGLDADDSDVDDDYDPADEFPERPAPFTGGRRWFLAALLVMAIGGGVLAWYNSQPETSEVPVLAGARQGEALNLLGPFTAEIVEEASEDVPAGAVIRTDPEAGTVLEHGKTVVLYVSIGPAPRPLPELTNLTVPDATAALQQIGLVLVEGDAVFSETVPVGIIVSWTVPSVPGAVAGDTVTKGTTVQVIASAGPAPRTVPNLTGFSLADATAAVQALDLVIAQGPDEFSDTIPAGQVMRQDPGPDAALQIGATVTVVLSKGPDLVTIPSLAGLDYNGIVAALQNAGFTIGTASGDTNLQLTGVAVNGVQVGAGQQFPRGTKVDLFFATAPPATPAP